MSKRIQLNNDEIEKIVGGAFNFYTSASGQPKCYIDDIGSYNCSGSAFSWFVERSAGSSDSAQTILNEGISLGYFWQ